MTNGREAVYFALFEVFPPMARWQSGDAADCKSVYAGSIPTRASIYFIKNPIKSMSYSDSIAITPQATPQHEAFI